MVEAKTVEQKRNAPPLNLQRWRVSLIGRSSHASNLDVTVARVQR
jgi:hypothetical protein